MKIEWGIMGPKGTKRLTARYIGEFRSIGEFYSNIRSYNHPTSRWTIYFRKLEKGEF